MGSQFPILPAEFPRHIPDTSLPKSFSKLDKKQPRTLFPDRLHPSSYTQAIPPYTQTSDLFCCFQMLLCTTNTVSVHLPLQSHTDNIDTPLAEKSDFLPEYPSYVPEYNLEHLPAIWHPVLPAFPSDAVHIKAEVLILVY